MDGEEYETGEESADGLDEPPSPSDDLDGGPKFLRTDSTYSAEIIFDHECYAVPSADGEFIYFSTKVSSSLYSCKGKVKFGVRKEAL